MSVEGMVLGARPREPPVRFANVRVLWSFVRPHRRPLLVAFALTVVTTGTMLATPMATKGILDGLADSAPWPGPSGSWSAC